MYDIYSIVRVEKYSYNKGEYIVVFCHVMSVSNKGTQRWALCIAVHSI